MNEKELAEIEARAEKAVEGPWIFDETNIGTASYRAYYGLITPYIRGDAFLSINVECGAEPEANFIAHARQDVPALVAEVRRLQTELTEMTEDRDSENRWAKTYFDHWNASRNDVEMLRAALEYYADIKGNDGSIARIALNGGAQ